jgi:hypothetical protein
MALLLPLDGGGAGVNFILTLCPPRAEDWLQTFDDPADGFPQGRKNYRMVKT